MGPGCSPSRNMEGPRKVNFYPLVEGLGEARGFQGGNGPETVPIGQPSFLPVAISLSVPVQHGSPPTGHSWFGIQHLHPHEI